MIKKLFQTQLILIFLVTMCVVFISFQGCIDVSDTMSFFDKELRRAQPYLDHIVFDDGVLLSYALGICGNCSHGDREEIINTLYRHIVETYQYIPDPEDKELIRTPYETMNINGGDCEDLSILLMSLLENLGIKTYLVLTDDHAYALAYDVDINHLWDFVEQSLIGQVEKDSGETLWQTYQETIILKARQNWYYGGEGELLNQSDSFDYLNITYDVESNRPIDMYLVSSKDDFHLFTNEQPFTYYPEHSYEQETSMQGTCCYLQRYGGVMLSNTGFRPCEVHVDFIFYSHPSFYKLFENNTIRTYRINEQDCVVLEPTAGPYGYPGYDANVTGKKTAIDPVSKEYFFLN